MVTDARTEDGRHSDARQREIAPDARGEAVAEAKYRLDQDVRTWKEATKVAGQVFLGSKAAL